MPIGRFHDGFPEVVGAEHDPRAKRQIRHDGHSEMVGHAEQPHHAVIGANLQYLIRRMNTIKDGFVGKHHAFGGVGGARGKTQERTIHGQEFFGVFPFGSYGNQARVGIDVRDLTKYCSL